MTVSNPSSHRCWLAAFLFLATAASVISAEKTHRQFRFTPTRLRENSGAANSVQVAEFRLNLHGQPLDMSQAVVTNPEGNSPSTEGPDRLIDGSAVTKWLDFNKRAVVFQFPQPVTVDAYSFITANDAAERDPANWRLEGSDDGMTWLLLDEKINATVPTARVTATQDFPLPVTVAPYASFWHPDYLLKWSPAADTSADFNRSNVPLAARTINPALQVNPNARVNEGRVTVLSAFGPTSFLPSQGAKAAHFNAYTGWQYTDQLVFWGGSAGEGIILAPSAPVIDAAHRNGVPVLGNVFFPPTAFGGRVDWVRTFLQKSGTTFPVADKLAEVARFYGFDGWFLNQETAGTNSTDAAAMRDFMIYLRAQAPELKIMWYDAMTESGSVSWQNALTTQNDTFMKNAGSNVAHSMFLNFWWNATGLTNSRNLATGLGIDPYSIYTGVDVESAGAGTEVTWDAIFPPGQPHKLSVAFYGQQAVFRNAGNPEAFRQNELKFWSGQNADPANTTTTSTWKGLAHYIPTATPLQKVPFVTNFNRGQGDRYAIDGTVLSTTGWNNLSLQDVLPTWRWVVKSTGSKLTPAILLDESYSGGSSLKITGTLDATNDIPLYAASLPVSSDTKFQIVYKTGQAAAASRMKLALTFEDAPAAPVYFDVGTTSTAGWNTVTFDLGARAGKKIATIGLQFASPAPVSNYLMRLGRISVFNGGIRDAAPVSRLRITQNDSPDADSLTVRLKWDASTTPNVYYYHVYHRLPNGSRKWLGATPASVFHAADVRRQGLETQMVFEVVTVGPDFGISNAVSVTAKLPPAPDMSRKLSGSSIGTPGSWGNLGDTRDKAFDGNPNSFFDAQEASAWTGLDLGTPKRLTAFRYMPRGGWAWRMPGGVFEAANQPDFSDAVHLFTVSATPTDWIFTTIPVTNPGLFRYFRFRSEGHGNVAEIEVFGFQIPTTPTGLAAGLSGGNPRLTWNPTSWAVTYRVERAATLSGPFTVIAPAATGTSFVDTTASGRPFYRISAVNPAGESAPTGVVQPPEPAGYPTWRAAEFPGETDPEIIAKDADPDADGLPNLLEYALGLAPREADAPSFAISREDGFLSILYTRRQTAPDVVLEAQWSDELVGWSSAGVSYEILGTNAGIESRRAILPAGETGNRFVRLKATSQ